jgi:hypothetical protein
MTTPLQACANGIVDRLVLHYPTLTMEQMIAKSGLPELVPDAVELLLAEGAIVLENNSYRPARRAQ